MRTPWGSVALVLLLASCASEARVLVGPAAEAPPAVAGGEAPVAAPAAALPAPAAPAAPPAVAPALLAPPAPGTAPAPAAPVPPAPAPVAPPPAAALPPAPPTTPVPEGSGTGRRVVYDMGTMHVWLVEVDGTVARDYPVSGHKYRKLPGTGAFWVYSKDRYTGVANSPTRMEFMVRFAWGNSGVAIGFHSIPTKHGRPIQRVDQLGTPASHGCVRQSYENAQFLFEWAPEGTPVNVVDTTGRVGPARPNNFPRGLRPITPIERMMTMPLLVSGPTLQ